MRGYYVVIGLLFGAALLGLLFAVWLSPYGAYLSPSLVEGLACPANTRLHSNLSYNSQRPESAYASAICTGVDGVEFPVNQTNLFLAFYPLCTAVWAVFFLGLRWVVQKLGIVKGVAEWVDEKIDEL